ncbi:hypothetical protein D3C83_210590 [compost metagenome]
MPDWSGRQGMPTSRGSTCGVELANQQSRMPWSSRYRRACTSPWPQSTLESVSTRCVVEGPPTASFEYAR